MNEEVVVLLFLVNCLLFCVAITPRTCPFALRNILPDHVQHVGDFCEPPTSAKCDLDTSYYTLDGSCNNLQSPSWGQARTPFARMAEANYFDGDCSLRKGSNGLPLPPARKIQTSVFTSQQKLSAYFNIFYYAFGEYLNLDVSLQLPVTSKAKCCNGNKLVENADPAICLATRIPEDDPFYSQYNVTCLEMTRSVNTRHQNCPVSPCIPINFQTAFLDLSTLYSTDINKLKKLRSHKNGQLLFDDIDGTGDEIFPPTVRGVEFCLNGGIEPGSGNACMASGDHRVNRNPELTVVDIIFLRAHNYLADTLLEHNSDWDDEKIFQEARRILIALYQNIIMAELMPLTLGVITMSSYGLLPASMGYSLVEYDPSVNAQTIIEYSFAAGRSHHNMVRGEVGYLNSKGAQVSYRLRDSFNNLKFMLQKTVYTNLLAAYLQQKSYQPTKYYSEDLTNFLEAVPGSEFGMDLISLDIDRGLDAGMPTYNAMRQACGLCRLNSFEDFIPEIMDSDDVQKLKSLYSTVDEMDFYVGGSLEIPIEGGTVGPTFACVIAENFFRWKTGDRLYFEFPSAKFSLAQLDAIRNSTIAWLLCKSNPNLQFVPRNAFLVRSANNDLINCFNMDMVDLSVFKVE